jgi:aryl-alcohol dehydrogenase-like predicted oxidoreductase
VTLQPQYSLLVREIEWEIVPACESTRLGLLPWSPLGGGWLTGKYTRDAPPAGATRLGEDPERGFEAYDRRSTDQRTWDVIDAVQSIASSRGVSMAQVALAWLLDRPLVSSVILGARTLEQLQDNLGAAGVHLTPDETARLDAASDPGAADYPYGEAGIEQRTRALDPVRPEPAAALGKG